MYFDFSQEVFVWLEDDIYRLCAESELKRELVRLYFSFFDAFLADFSAAQSALLQAIHLAEELSEFSWYLFLRRNLLFLWFHYDLLKHALYESFSLLPLIDDERFHASLHLPYACHDIAACYILLDPVGYYKEIIANSQEAIIQPSASHFLTLTAYRHCMLASAAAQYSREAERWLALLQSFEESADFFFDFALAYEYLESWPQAKYYYLESAKNASSSIYLAVVHFKSLLGAALAHCSLNEIAEAECLLARVYPLLSTSSHSLSLGRLFEVEAALALTDTLLERAVSFFTQAAHIYLEFSLYRSAMLCGLQAAELARSAHLPDLSQALSLASQAARMLPPLTHDLMLRFAAFSCQPLSASSELLLSPLSVTHKQLRERGLAILKTSLRVSLTCIHLPLVSLLLLLLARAYLEPDCDLHLAISYLVWHLALEYTHRSSLSLDDSVALLLSLYDEQKRKPIDEILRALLASPPPGWLTQLSEELSATCLQTFLRSLLRFLSDPGSSSLLQEVLANEK